MPKRERDPFDHFDADAQARHRPDQAPSSKPEAPSEKRVQINAQVPVSLRNRFKAKAASEGRTMSELMIQWVHEYLGETPER